MWFVRNKITPGGPALNLTAGWARLSILQVELYVVISYKLQEQCRENCLLDTPSGDNNTKKTRDCKVVLKFSKFKIIIDPQESNMDIFMLSCLNKTQLLQRYCTTTVTPGTVLLVALKKTMLNQVK